MDINFVPFSKQKNSKTMIIPKKYQLMKITVNDKEFVPKKLTIVIKDTKILITDLYNKKLFEIVKKK